MYETGKRELAKAHSLMERMERHLTAEQAQMITEQKTQSLLEENANYPGRSDILTIDGQGHMFNTPEGLIRGLTKNGISPQKAWYVTLGYVKAFTEVDVDGVKKTLRTAVDNFDPSVVAQARELNSPRINQMIDNPQRVAKGINKGKIINPLQPNSKAKYVVEASVVRLMYGINPEWGEEKERVRSRLRDYEKENPDKVQAYLQSKGLMDFAGQAYDDARQSSEERIDGTNIFKKGENKYNMRFKTPYKVYKKLRSAYFVIDDDNDIKPLSEDEAKMYIKLFAVEPTHRVATYDVVKEVDDIVKKIKDEEHQSLWTNYDLDKVFLLNFSTKESGGENKLTYFNPNVIVEYVEENTSKSNPSPARTTAPGAFSKHLEPYKPKTELPKK